MLYNTLQGSLQLLEEVLEQYLTEEDSVDLIEQAPPSFESLWCD